MHLYLIIPLVCVDKLVDSREWKAIFGACLVEVRVIDADLPLPVWLLHRDYVCHPLWQLRFFDEVGCQQLLDFFVDGDFSTSVHDPVSLARQMVGHSRRQRRIRRSFGR